MKSRIKSQWIELKIGRQRFNCLVTAMRIRALEGPIRGYEATLEVSTSGAPVRGSAAASKNPKKKR